jgi:hypothetical protein
MGWADANIIFDDLATTLQRQDATAELKLALLVPLIRALQDRDWDTESESLLRFLDDPVIVDAFARQGVCLEDTSYGSAAG